MNTLLLILILAQTPVGNNQPPLVPDSIKCPTYADTVWPITLLVKTQDPEHDSIAYQIDWGDDTVLVWSRFLSKGFEVEFDHTYKRMGDFSIRVRVKDKQANISDWSKTLPITVGKDIIKWRFDAMSSIYSTPALDDQDNIYFGTETGVLYSLNKAGEVLWRFQTGGPIYTSPVIGKKSIYFCSSDSSLYCLDFAGNKKWQFKVGGDIFSTPAVDDREVVYFGSDDGKFYAVNDKGQLSWSYQTGDEVLSSPAIGLDNTIYFTSDSIYAVTPAGKRRYAFSPPEPGDYFTSPIVDPKSIVYCGCTDGYLYAILPQGRMKWRAATIDQDEIRSDPAIGLGDTILVGCDDGFIYKKGKFGPMVPVFESEDIVLATPVMDAEGHIYFLSDDGFFYCLERNGKLRWKLEIAVEVKSVYVTSAATIGKDHTIYVGTQDNFLYAFNGTSGIPKTPWPTFHQNVKHTGKLKKGK